MINIYSCNSLSEAYQKQYKYAIHRRRLSEISNTNQKSDDFSYETLKLKLTKNKIMRKQFEAQEKLDSLIKSQRLFYSRFSPK